MMVSGDAWSSVSCYVTDCVCSFSVMPCTGASAGHAQRAKARRCGTAGHEASACRPLATIHPSQQTVQLSSSSQQARRTCRPTVTEQPPVAASPKRRLAPTSSSMPAVVSLSATRPVAPTADDSWRTARATTPVTAPTCGGSRRPAAGAARGGQARPGPCSPCRLLLCVDAATARVRAQAGTPAHTVHHARARTSRRPASSSFSVRRVRPMLMPEASGGPTTQLYSPLTVGDSWRWLTNCATQAAGSGEGRRAVCARRVCLGAQRACAPGMMAPMAARLPRRHPRWCRAPAMFFRKQPP